MRTALLALAAFALAQPLRAQQLPVKGYGQELVDQVMAKERGLLVVVMHVSPPGAANYPIIASNIGRMASSPPARPTWKSRTAAPASRWRCRCATSPATPSVLSASSFLIKRGRARPLWR